MQEDLVQPFALTVAYTVCLFLAPVFVTGIGARLYGFRQEWAVLILAYILTPVALVFVAFGVPEMKVDARVAYMADTPIYPSSYAFDVICFLVIFLVPIVLTILHIRDPHKGTAKASLPDRAGPTRDPFPFADCQLPPRPDVPVGPGAHESDEPLDCRPRVENER